MASSSLRLCALGRDSNKSPSRAPALSDFKSVRLLAITICGSGLGLRLQIVRRDTSVERYLRKRAWSSKTKIICSTMTTLTALFLKVSMAAISFNLVRGYGAQKQSPEGGSDIGRFDGSGFMEAGCSCGWNTTIATVGSA
jgi:hypothetical protein